MDNAVQSIVKQYGFEKFAAHVAEHGSDTISEREFIAAGNAEYGKAKFSEMLATDATVYAACKKLQSGAVQKWESKYFPSPADDPAYVSGLQEIAAAEAAKGAAAGKSIPIARHRQRGARRPRNRGPATQLVGGKRNKAAPWLSVRARLCPRPCHLPSQ